jgi:hypothetical protein
MRYVILIIVALSIGLANHGLCVWHYRRGYEAGCIRGGEYTIRYGRIPSATFREMAARHPDANDIEVCQFLGEYFYGSDFTMPETAHFKVWPNGDFGWTTLEGEPR